MKILGVRLLRPIYIDELFVSNHPGFQLLNNYPIINEKQLPTFLDYVSLVFQKFNSYVERSEYGLHFGDQIVDLIEMLRALCETDEPEIVFKVRAELRKTIPLVQDELSKMGKCFTSPSSIQDFYEDIASALYRSSMYIMGDSIYD